MLHTSVIGTTALETTAEHIAAHQAITLKTNVDPTHKHPTTHQSTGHTRRDCKPQYHIPTLKTTRPIKKEHEGPNRRTSIGLLPFWWQFNWLSRGIGILKLEKPSHSSDSHEQGGPPPPTNQVTITHITDYPTITVHVGKWYKTLIDPGAVISLVRYSTNQTIDKKYKMTIQVTSIQLNTTDRSSMTALGMTTLQLRITDFKFSTPSSYVIGYPKQNYYLS